MNTSKNKTLASSLALIAFLGVACTAEQDLGDVGASGRGGNGAGGSQAGGGQTDNAKTASGGSAGKLDNSGPDGDSNVSEVPQTPGGKLQIKNLNLSAVQGKMVMTFILENRTGKSIERCQLGQVTSNTEHTARVDLDYSRAVNRENGIDGIYTNEAWCRGFWPAPDPGWFCADRELASLCEFGDSGSFGVTKTEVVEVSAFFDGEAAWEQLGTEYKLSLRVLLDDAEVVDVSATTTLK